MTGHGDGDGVQVARLMRAVREGRLSRRQFMRRTVALGFSASAVAAFLAACGEATGTGGGGGATTTTTTATSGGTTTTAAGGAGGARATTAAAATTTTTAAAPAATTGAGGTTARTTGAGTAPATGAATGAPIPNTATRTGVTDTEVVIGNWGPQDGPAGAYGSIARTIGGYFNWVNNTAGGASGRRIRYITENDSYSTPKTVAAVRKLVEEDRVFALVGGLGTPNNVAVEKYLVDNFIPHIAPATGSSLMSIPLKRNIFAVQLNYIVEATLLARYALDTLGSKKFAIISQNDAFGKEGLDSVQAELQRRGLPAATSVTYETTDTNYSAQVLRLQSSGADTVVIWAVPQPGGGIIQEMTRLGFKPKILASAVINDPSIFRLAGPGIEGTYSTGYIPDFKDTSDPKIVEYRNWMGQNLPNEQIGSFTETGYMYGQIMTELLNRTGRDLTRENFVRTAEALQNYTGSLLPSLSFSPTDHQGAKQCYISQAKGGEFVKISDYLSL